MKSRLGAVLFSFLFFAFAISTTPAFAAAKSKIDQEQVLALLKSADDAARDMEVQPILDLLAKDVEVTIAIKNPNGNKSLHFDRKQYESYLKQGLAAITGYVAEHKDRKIVIAKDGKTAEVTEMVLEKSTVGDKRISCKSRQTVSLILQGSGLLIKHIDAEVLSIQQSGNTLKEERTQN
jgi:hypothetical protein